MLAVAQQHRVLDALSIEANLRYTTFYDLCVETTGCSPHDLSYHDAAHLIRAMQCLVDLHQHPEE